MLVEGRQKLDMGQKRIEFGEYALVYVGTSNDMKKRSVPSISLTSSNDFGGYYFMSLYTGKKLHSYVWTELPIDNDVIKRVEELATQEQQPFLLDNHPIFEWEPGTQIIIDENEEQQEEIEHVPELDVAQDEQ